MKTIPHRHHAAGKRKIRQRLDRPVTTPSPDPVFTASNIHYDAATKTQAISCGGIGAIPLLVRKLGLAEAIDERLHLLKYHLPYHESDHVLNFAYNALCNGTCLDDIELRRNDVVFLDALVPTASPTPPPRVTSADASAPTTSRPSRTSSIRPDGSSGSSSRPTSSTRPSSTSTALSWPPARAARRASTSPTTAPGVITR